MQAVSADVLTNEDWDHLAGILEPGQDRSAQSLSTTALAFLLIHLRRRLQRPLVCVTDGPRTQDQLFEDLVSLRGGEDERLGYYPAWETIPGPDRHPQPDLVGDRLFTVQRFVSGHPPEILVTTIQSLLQRTISPTRFSATTASFAVNDEVDLDALSGRLQAVGYAFEPQVSVKGEASLRGGIFDLWPLTEPWPLRLEFFGPVLESIRRFDPHDQRSLERLDTVAATPATESGDPSADSSYDGDLVEVLPGDACLVWFDPPAVEHHAEVYRETILELQAESTALTRDALQQRITEALPSGSLYIGAGGPPDIPHRQIGIEPLAGLPALPTEATAPDLLEGERKRFLGEIAARCAAGHAVSIFFSTSGSRDRFQEEVEVSFPAFAQSALVHVGRIDEGFEAPATGYVVVAENDLYGKRKTFRGRYDPHARRKGPARLRGSQVLDWTDLQPGELVVHLDHGIGRYEGLEEMTSHGMRQEVLVIEYAENARIYLPVSQSQILTRYSGVGKQNPNLHRLGGRRWKNEKAAAAHSVIDLAGSLMDTQALRTTQAGIAFSPDTPWQHDFEATFPFEETADQSQAIRDVKADMERPLPMDRLVCGDVGYGKTEVAMRAAFKSVMQGKQVAVLVPTTVLAQQHYDTFSARMAAFPVTIEMLSRFQTKSRQREVLARLKEGGVDIIIGTHRLIQKDVGFKDLGLFILDEEQRFGVTQKEHLKQIRRLVDVLTLTATPIPRTLYLSLMGAKDISTIQSPPQERLPIETIVAPYDDELVRQAILREINREGQVYFLHNRVVSIDRTAERLTDLVPEARIAVAHGQMHENELSTVMRTFVQGRYDVLLCTTIIESGVDIPNVNTIIIDRADRFGLAELYQLRGRVGRYKHKAYAYLMLPRGGALLDAAKQRIAALQRYGGLGAGFKLALKDLEIRGTGNLLGAEQSGHITAVGFELYCQLLKQSVARLRGDEVARLVDVDLRLDFMSYATGEAAQGHTAVIPPGYIDDDDLRVHAYRKIATASSEVGLDALFGEFRDRFGPVPPALNRLLKMCRIRLLAAERGIESVEGRDDKIILSRSGDFIKKGTRFPRFPSEIPDDKLNRIVQVLRNVPRLNPRAAVGTGALKA